MSDSFNTDGMFGMRISDRKFGMPVIDDNCLESIERTIAFDVRDWSEDRRSAWIFGIIFGWDEGIEEVKGQFKWSDEDVDRMNRYHLQWEKLKKSIQEGVE